VKYKIAILIPYFGAWPAWIDFFVESCRANSTIDWILFSDSDPPENQAPNVNHVKCRFEEYKAVLSEALGSDLSAIEPYKICDFRPALGFVHGEMLGSYDFIGTGDLDIRKSTRLSRARNSGPIRPHLVASGSRVRSFHVDAQQRRSGDGIPASAWLEEDTRVKGLSQFRRARFLQLSAETSGTPKDARPP
jgi:hypothetical protein